MVGLPCLAGAALGRGVRAAAVSCGATRNDLTRVWLDLGLSTDDPTEDCVVASWIWSKEDRSMVRWGQKPLGARRSRGDASDNHSRRRGADAAGELPKGPLTPG